MLNHVVMTDYGSVAPLGYLAEIQSYQQGAEVVSKAEISYHERVSGTIIRQL